MQTRLKLMVTSGKASGGAVSSPPLDLKASDFKLLWAAAFLVTAVFGYGLTPWDTISDLIQSEGALSDDQTAMLAFAAGYTLPATVGFAIVAYLYQTHWFAGRIFQYNLLAIAVIFAGSAAVSATLGLGLLPDTATQFPASGPTWGRVCLWVLAAYLNSYGFGLLLTAGAIGSVAGLHGEHLMRSEKTT